MRTTRTVTSAGLTALLLVVAACSADESARETRAGGVIEDQPTVLTLPQGSQLVQPQFREFADQVEELSDGTIQIEFPLGWREGEPDFERGMIDDVMAGTVDMAGVGARVLDQVGVTSFQAMLAPLLVDSHDLQEAVFDSGIPARMLEDVNQNGLTGIAITPGPMRKVLGVDHPFTSPDDFAGMTVGHNGGELAATALGALGATPQQVEVPAPIDALDGLDHQVAAIAGQKYYDHARYLTGNINLWPRPLVIVMNSDRFDSLTPKQQHAMLTAGATAVGPALDASREEDAEGGRNMCHVGMTVVEAADADLAAMQTALQPVYAELEQDLQTKAYLDEIRALKQQVGAPPESFTCDEDADTTDASALEGEWTANVTCAQTLAALERAGFTSEEVDEVRNELQELEGQDPCVDTTIVVRWFRGGIWENQSDGDSEPWIGRYEVVDERTLLAGETSDDLYWTLEYTIDGDQLTFKVIETRGGDLFDLITATVFFESGPFTRTN